MSMTLSIEFANSTRAPLCKTCYVSFKEGFVTNKNSEIVVCDDPWRLVERKQGAP